LRKTDEVFAVISPKLALDHYLTILSLIDWQLSIEGKQNFTISDITDHLLGTLHGKDVSAFHRRVCSRSLGVV